MKKIHPSAIIDSTATIGEDTSIAPFCVIGSNVKIGNNCHIGPSCFIDNNVNIGNDNFISGHSVIGTEPQDLKYDGEETSVIIGNGNKIREFVTIHRGTGNGGVTKAGNNNLFMAYSHIAHDCTVNDNIIMANCATLAGHVMVGSLATIGAFSAVHQYCKIGDYSFIGGFSIITKDALPFIKTVGSRGEAHIYGINTIGLERREFSPDVIKSLKAAYKILFSSKMILSDAVAKTRKDYGEIKEVAFLLEFIEKSERGITR